MKALNFSILFLFIIISACKEPNTSNPQIDCNFTSINNNNDVLGYGILEQIPGIWNGPVTSSTPLGSYPEWIVDFRPISASNVSAKNELDDLNDIFMSFFIVKHDCEAKVAFRNGGGFDGNVRNSYMLIDSVYESASLNFYRFSDPVSDGNRVFSEVTFKQDSMKIHVYTNKFNQLNEPVSHMHWKASLRDETSATTAINQFNYPKKQLEKDFSSTFNGLNEAVFYSAAQDPFPEEDQPYLGQSTVNVNISNPATLDASKKVLIIISTQPFFNGFNFVLANLKYRSRYVFIDANTSSTFKFNYMHPGTYYVNAIYDTNGDFNFSSGDYMNSNFDIPLTLADEGSNNSSVDINFQIP